MDSRLRDHAAGPLVQHRRGGEAHLGEAAGYLNEGYERRSFEAVGVLTVQGLPRPIWEYAPAALGLGLAWLVPCGRRTSRSAQRTRSLGRTGVHTDLKNPYSTGPTNWLACTRSIRLSLTNRCARLARLPNSNGIFLRKINVVPSHTVLGGSPEYISHLACVSHQARRHSEEFPCIHPLYGIRLSPQIRNTADVAPRRVQSTFRIPYH